MSGGPQIHIFFGAPILPNPEEAKFSASITETWRKQYFSFTKNSCNLCPRKRRSSDLEYQIPDDDVLDSNSRGHLTTNFGEKCELTGVSSANCVDNNGNLKPVTSKTRVIDKSTDISCDVYKDESIENHPKHLISEQLADVTSNKQTKQSEDSETNASCTVFNHHAIKRYMMSVGQDDKQSDIQSNHLVSQFLEIHSPQIMKQSKFDKPGVSTNAEFLNVLTFSKAALSQSHAVGQNEVQNKPTMLKGTGELHKEDEEAAILHSPLNENGGICTEVAEKDFSQDFNNSHELCMKNNSSLRENSFQNIAENNFQKNTCIYADFTPPTDGKYKNEVGYIGPCKKKIFCLQGSHSDKKSQASKDTFLAAANATVVDDQQLSKKYLLSCSPVCSIRQIEQLRISGLKVQQHPSLLKDCLCKGQKYTILVAVLHPCHIKEIQMRSQSKLSSGVPLSTIVVFDQSEVQWKIMLWRAAAFWSLTVFPGDIILLTDVIIYENQWIGEMMLQSTRTSQLLNLGSCSSIGQKELSYAVNVNTLQDLLEYISLKYAFLQDLPQRQKQTLNNIQHVQLDQLKPDTLLHSVVKIIDIMVLTESTNSYKGEGQKRIILTVKQVTDQHCVLILWGALTAGCPQLQRKRDYIWEFKYLFAKHNPVSGELELHTTPWSSMECLFNDDKRAVEFKEKFEKNSKLLVNVTSLPTHLEEKCSGLIQVKAHISELKFSVASFPSGQLIFDAKTTLQHIFTSLELIIYAGCAKCGLELNMDDNKIYKQCVSCLPFNKLKIFYRPALMTVQEEGYQISVWVMPKLMEKMFLNIPAECLSKAIEPSIDATYGMVVADLCHSLLTDTKANYLLTIRSHFVLDENSCPLEKNFHLLDFHLEL